MNENKHRICFVLFFSLRVGCLVFYFYFVFVFLSGCIMRWYVIVTLFWTRMDITILLHKAYLHLKCNSFYMTFVYATVKRKILLQTYTDCYSKQISWIPGMVAHAIVVLACKQFVLLCFVYLGLYSFNSFNITLSWSAIMLLDSVLINTRWMKTNTRFVLGFFLFSLGVSCLVFYFVFVFVFLSGCIMRWYVIVTLFWTRMDITILLHFWCLSRGHLWLISRGHLWLK
jgi:hypothetical protein